MRRDQKWTITIMMKFDGFQKETVTGRMKFLLSREQPDKLDEIAPAYIFGTRKSQKS